ncbi:MAG: hypothetical protein HWN65_11565 [Candidatus Helarchaeota archaeon]|nr:hypothetical protein [Candidatus Helarchaeota archaeon]
MKNGKQMLQELKSRKQILVEQLKELSKRESSNTTSSEELTLKKREIERELVEIMDRLTQLSYILKK